MSPRSLSNLMNRHVFACAGAPLKDIEVSIESGHLKQTGTARKGVDVPFSLIAEVSVTSDGRIRLHPISMKVMGVQTAGLMKLLGIGMGGFITLKESSGMEIEGDDFLMSPARMLPLPKFAGRLTLSDTDLEIVGEVADRAIELSVPHQKNQLVAGYAKTRPNGGLVVHVPDYKAPAVSAPPHRP